MPCCVNGIYLCNFLLADTGDSFSEVTGLKLKPTEMTKRKLRKFQETRTSTPRLFQAKVYLT